jgi:NifB/MoaA-like Fe-S oxidoreductase
MICWHWVRLFKALPSFRSGLTRYRAENHLFPLRPLDAADAAEVIAEVNRRQAAMLAERQIRLVYAADEIYLKAGIGLPPAEAYDDFPQLENGVGMGSLFRSEMQAGLAAQAIVPVAPLWSAYPDDRQPERRDWRSW